MNTSRWAPCARGSAWWLGHESGRGWRLLGMVTMAMAAATLVGNMGLEQRRQADLRAQRLHALERQHALLSRRAPPAATPMVLITGRAVAVHNEAVHQLNIPWPMVLQVFEAQTRPDVALTLLEPDGRKQVIQVQAEARGIQTLLTFSEALSKSDGMEQLILQQHETNEQDPNQPARLSFSLRMAPTAWEAR